MFNLLVILILIVIYIKCIYITESFNGKPSYVDINNRVDEIIKYRDSFNNFYYARKKMPWIDAIIYEDVRNKIRYNQFDRDYLVQIFN